MTVAYVVVNAEELDSSYSASIVADTAFPAAHLLVRLDFDADLRPVCSVSASDVVANYLEPYAVERIAREFLVVETKLGALLHLEPETSEPMEPSKDLRH